MNIEYTAFKWSSTGNVKEEKDENTDDEKESKQAAHNQLHFPFHLWMMTVTMMEMIKWMVTINSSNVSEKKPA